MSVYNVSDEAPVVFKVILALLHALTLKSYIVKAGRRRIVNSSCRSELVLYRKAPSEKVAYILLHEKGLQTML